mgnify:CR=1 FL=1
MSRETLLSVIIPVYNVEEFLKDDKILISSDLLFAFHKRLLFCLHQVL